MLARITRTFAMEKLMPLTLTLHATTITGRSGHWTAQTVPPRGPDALICIYSALLPAGDIADFDQAMEEDGLTLQDFLVDSEIYTIHTIRSLWGRSTRHLEDVVTDRGERAELAWKYYEILGINWDFGACDQPAVRDVLSQAANYFFDKHEEYLGATSRTA